MKKSLIKPNIIIFASLLIATFGSWYLARPSARTPDVEKSATYHVNRIVSGYAAFTEILTSLGVEDRIVAATRGDAKLLKVTSIGSHMKPDLEAVVSANPDLVLLSSRRPQFTEVLRNRLSESDAVIVDAHPESIEGVFAFIAKLGVLCDREKQAELLISRSRELLKPVDEAVARVPQAERPVVFLEVRSSPSLLTCGRNSIAFDIIKRAGGRPLCSFKGGVTRIDVESVVDGNPALYIQQFGAMNRNPLPVSEHPVLGSLSCVRASAVVRIDEKLISRPGPRVAEAVVRIYRELYDAK